MVMSPAGLETKNNCAGEGQQQFSSQSVRVTCSLQRRVSEVSGSAGGPGRWRVKTQPRYSELSSQSSEKSQLQLSVVRLRESRETQL
jgi:hypothetical protein